MIHTKRKLGTAASALGIAAATLVAFAGCALADGPRGHGRYGFNRPPIHAGPGPRFAHGGERHRRGSNGAAIALGIGALFVGAMLAAEANRRHGDRYDD